MEFVFFFHQCLRDNAGTTCDVTSASAIYSMCCALRKKILNADTSPATKYNYIQAIALDSRKVVVSRSDIVMG
jgi:hypothetical protein